VLLEIAAGATNRQIARKLVISEHTVSIHVSRVLAKLGVSNRTAAAAIVHRSGLR
jgi:DNA-binding NarL/FixJ family response regulator